MNAEELAPAIGQRGVIVGRTGTGKSTLARVLVYAMAQRQPLVIIDPKGDFAPPVPCMALTGAGQSLRGRNIIYRPSLDSDVVSDVDSILRSVYNAGNCAVYIDELFGIQEKGNYPPALLPLYTRGRSRGITVLGAVQRPCKVPLETISECDRHYTFALQMGDDRRRMAEVSGRAGRGVPPRYHFWYSVTNAEEDASIPDAPLTLRMPE